MPGGRMDHGDKRSVKIMIDGEMFEARMNNIGFDQAHYPGHPDLLQVRYSPGSPIAKKLQSVFMEEYNYLLNAREGVARRQHVHLPEELSSEIVLYATVIADTFIMECQHTQDTLDLRQELSAMEEEEFETFIPREDKGATIKQVTRLQRVRQLDRSIGDSLKILYDYRCQMTGERIGEQHDALCVEAHHIIPFTESMNNDTSNIIILSPTYHRIIHKAKPTFDSDLLAFKFPNGLVEKVMLDKHLKR